MIMLEILSHLRTRSGGGQKRNGKSSSVPYEALNDATSSCHMLLLWMLSCFEREERTLSNDSSGKKGNKKKHASGGGGGGGGGGKWSSKCA